jgi:hypothetical protein
VSESGGSVPSPVPPPVPVVRVVSGDPTDTELAALLAVLAAVSGAPAVAEPAPLPPSEWARPTARLRAPLLPRADGWRRSALPR